MGFEIINASEIAAGQPVTQALWQKVKDSLDYLYSQVGAGGGGGGGGGGGVPNGSFEVDADADGVPDGWTKNLYPAGGGAIETTSPMHGAKAYKFVQQAGPGNGGGYLDQTEYLACSPLQALLFIWNHYATAVGMHNIVQTRWFDKAKVYISTSDIYNSTSNPTSAAIGMGVGIPPATAFFYKLRIIGGYYDTDIAGTAYFDGFSVHDFVPPLNWHMPDSISERSSVNMAYGDVGSPISIPLPTLSSKSIVRFTIRGQLKGKDMTEFMWQGKMRFRMGSQYSNEYLAPSDVYVASTFSWLCYGLSGTQSMYMQLGGSEGYQPVYGKTDADTITYEILAP